MSNRTRRSRPGGAPQPALRRPAVQPRRSRPRGRRLSGLLLFLCGVVVGAALLRTFGCGRPAGMGGGSGREAGRGSQEEDPPAGAPARSAQPRHASSATGGEEPRSSSSDPSSTLPAGPAEPRIALVIDDLGRSVADVEALARLGVPLTYAVLPYETETPQVVEELQRLGAEVLCHLPMEPNGSGDPGPGALWYGMGSDELRHSTAEALAAVPGAVGVNNHMGSRLSADEPSMRSILGVLAEHRLFFLDSRTSAESVGYRTALALGLPAAERQVFLDADQKPESIKAQFARLYALARERGEAIAIGHPHGATLAALAEEIPLARAQGFRFVRVSELLRQPAGKGP